MGGRHSAAPPMRPTPPRRQSAWTRVPRVALILAGIAIGVLFAMPRPQRSDLKRVTLQTTLR